MLVPLNLAALAWRQSHLSPELTLGWRLGSYAHECFDGLDQVRIAATGHTHTLAALARLACFPEPGMVFRPAGSRPWDMLFSHEPTATALKVVCIRKRTTLPLAALKLQSNMDRHDPAVVGYYQEAVDELVSNIVNGDLAGLCLITEIRCRVLDVDKSRLPASCPWCRTRSFTRLIEVNGRIGCPVCSGLEPQWLAMETTGNL